MLIACISEMDSTCKLFGDELFSKVGEGDLYIQKSRKLVSQVFIPTR